MKARPLIFSGPMVRAIRDRHKTQTRRVIRSASRLNGRMMAGEEPDWCPYGGPRDTLVLVCAWAVASKYDHLSPSKLPKSVAVWTLFDCEQKRAWCGRTRRARYIPKWLYRRFPKATIASVRTERLQDITWYDIRAEGIDCPEHDFDGGFCCSECAFLRAAFVKLWDSLNANRGYGWDMNPRVWVIEFKQVASVD